MHAAYAAAASNAFEYFQLPSLDRTGSRYFSGGTLRNVEIDLQIRARRSRRRRAMRDPSWSAR